MFKEIMKIGEAELTYEYRKSLSQKPMLKNLFWETTLRCNARCKHCGSRAVEQTKLTDELRTEEIKNAFKSISEKYDASKILINVTGGEPLVRDDLFEVMKYASDLGYKWGMTTNGILINDEIISKMKETKMGTVSISIDGLEKTHDEFRGMPGSYKKIMQNIKKLREAKFLYCLQVTTVVSKSSINELDELYKVMKDLGVDSWRIVNMDPIGRANDNAIIALEANDYRRLIDFIKDKRKHSKFDITYGCSHFLGIKDEKEVRSQSFFCHTGYLTGSILYNGDIFVCPNVPRRKDLIQGNIRKDDFVNTWENGFKWFRNEDRQKCTECEKCKDYKYCKGDSLHTWNFEENKPNLCLNKLLKEAGK